MSTKKTDFSQFINTDDAPIFNIMGVAPVAPVVEPKVESKSAPVEEKTEDKVPGVKKDVAPKAEKKKSQTAKQKKDASSEFTDEELNVRITISTRLSKVNKAWLMSEGVRQGNVKSYTSDFINRMIDEDRAKRATKEFYESELLKSIMNQN